MFRRLSVAFSLILLFVAAPLHAAVTLTFYSKEFGTSFPHAFVALDGTIGPENLPVNVTYGFTAKRISPAILMGDVEGIVEGVTPSYRKASDAHFSVVLTDEQYGKVLETVEKWRDIPGKSYNLNKRNCVFFVGDIARAAGLTVVDDPRLMKKPRSYTQNLMRLNPHVLPAQVPEAVAVTAAN